MIVQSKFVVLSALVTGAVSAISPVSDLHIVNQNIAPDGFNRDAVLAGGTFPGPLITANKGDSFSVNVHNDLVDGTMDLVTAVHWHGITQHTTTWADGVAFVSQCPIVPGNSFHYSFNPGNQVGTYWYHSHYRAQYCDGLRGVIVIYDPNDPYKSLYDVDDESTVITLADWYRYPAPQVQPGLGHVAHPASTLINGLGRALDGPADAPLAVINVVQGRRYRFRLVSLSCFPNFIFSIAGHNMTVIEADGEYTQPLVVDSVNIYAGQRYSVVVNATQTVDNYWICSQPILPLGANLTIDNSCSNTRNSAIFRYQGAQETEPQTSFSGNGAAPLIETNLHALVNPAAPGTPGAGGADENINLQVTLVQEPSDNTSFVYQVNGVTFESPDIPTLLQIISGLPVLLPIGSTYRVPRNKVIELTIPTGAQGGEHPVHLHGHSFSVVRSGGSDSYNYVNPVRRDVVSMGPQDSNSNVTIRFTTDNPGPWIFHCHIDWHLEEGFAVVFAEDVPSIALTNPVPLEWSALCPIYNTWLLTHPN
ncbi:laccase [Heterobasidion irregulare TC 32-1]|uniref:Laccase n=1 Tax=Heterobasidion irregulare (strain TC 32-1) TaxID=747525 RepID=W4KCB2_HETIT|nr:laccase [Heterobasidion irregulare TC 32-1]ETW83507.1 laccase [Heterobasidion irregulare TC 32-1]